MERARRNVWERRLEGFAEARLCSVTLVKEFCLYLEDVAKS